MTIPENFKLRVPKGDFKFKSKFKSKFQPVVDASDEPSFAIESDVDIEVQETEQEHALMQLMRPRTLRVAAAATAATAAIAAPAAPAATAATAALRLISGHMDVDDRGADRDHLDPELESQSMDDDEEIDESQVHAISKHHDDLEIDVDLEIEVESGDELLNTGSESDRDY